jgi:N-acetylglucosaminyldiphosphoundecaprenol N-acetyl-beta-D-mannosaminyltransferase
MEIIDFAGIKIDNLSLSEAAARVEELLLSESSHLIVTPNPEIIVASQKDPDLKNIVNQASLRVPDGISMVVVSRILGKPLKERVAGIDLMLKILEKQIKTLKVFLLGGEPGVAEGAAQKLAERFSTIQIVGAQNGYFQNNSEIVSKIKAAKPDILFVGLGAGRQEKWIYRHLAELQTKVCMAVGGSFDVISGRKKRAPKWMRTLYVEWLYRLVKEPKRLKRQLALPKFLWLMFLPTNRSPRV